MKLYNSLLQPGKMIKRSNINFDHRKEVFRILINCEKETYNNEITANQHQLRIYTSQNIGQSLLYLENENEANITTIAKLL